MMWKYAIAGFMCLASCYGFPNGAPASVCDAWSPRHIGTSAQPEDSIPFLMAVSSETYNLSQGITNVTVTIDSPDEDTLFKGFVVAAFNDDGELAGEWVESAGTKRISKCKGALSHSNGKGKSHISLTWMPPAGSPEGLVQMRATIVKNYKTYWTFVPISSEEK